MKNNVSLLASLAASKALSHGKTFDLCYANYGNPGFDPDRHFAFLKYCPGELKLVAANFSGLDTEMAIRIPAHAFEYFSIPETPGLNSKTPVCIKTGAWDGAISDLI